MRQPPRLKRHSTLFPLHIKTFLQWSCCKGSEVPAAWQFVVADNDCFRSFLYTRRIWVTLRDIYIYILIQSVVSVPLSIFILIWWTIFSSMKKGSCLFWPSIHASIFFSNASPPTGYFHCLSGKGDWLWQWQYQMRQGTIINYKSFPFWKGNRIAKSSLSQ